jgi:head-tail adaptor
MINYCDSISVLTSTKENDGQGGVTEVWSTIHKSTFDSDLSVGILTVGSTITGSVNGYTAVITGIDYNLSVIEYAALSNDDDFEVSEELTDDSGVPSSVTLVSVLGTVDSQFRGRLAKLTGNEEMLSSRIAERSTHILFIPNKPITALNRIEIADKIYNVLSVYPGRDLFGILKHIEVQLELVE